MRIPTCHCNYAGFLSPRHFSSSMNQNESQSDKDKSNTADIPPLTFIEKWRPHSMKIGIGAAASLTLYGLSSFMWDITYNVMTMSPASGMYYGFISGVGSTALCAASLYYTRTATRVDVNEILIQARRSLNTSEDLRSLLGGYIYVGDLAASRYSYGSWRVSGFRPKWKPPTVDIIFNVYCGKNEGVATIIASQNGLYGRIDFLGVDVLNKTASRVLVHGDGQGFETHDALQALVRFKSTSDHDIDGKS